MISEPLEIEGTWEQIAALEPSLRGRRLRVTVLDKTADIGVVLDKKPLSAIFDEIRAESPELWNDLPADLAEQHDHYIYGTPKK